MKEGKKKWEISKQFYRDMHASPFYEAICPHSIGHHKGVHGCDIQPCCTISTIVVEWRNMKTRKERRGVATSFVEEMNSKTKCVKCGETPIEWHRKEHEDKPNSRVSSLRTQGVSIKRIEDEIKLCVPLCRKCHMEVDGRLASLRKNQPFQKGNTYIFPVPCVLCAKLSKPTRKGLCYSCYENHRVGGRNYKGHPFSMKGCCETAPKEIWKQVSKD